MTWDCFSCILGFQNFPRGCPPPPTTLQEEIHEQMLDLILLSNLCATPPPPPPLIIQLVKLLDLFLMIFVSLYLFGNSR